jgi:trimeric autotransporter adhesin
MPRMNGKSRGGSVSLSSGILLGAVTAISLTLATSAAHAQGIQPIGAGVPIPVVGNIYNASGQLGVVDPGGFTPITALSATGAAGQPWTVFSNTGITVNPGGDAGGGKTELNRNGLTMHDKNNAQTANIDSVTGAATFAKGNAGINPDGSAYFNNKQVQINNWGDVTTSGGNFVALSPDGNHKTTVGSATVEIWDAAGNSNTSSSNRTVIDVAGVGTVRSGVASTAGNGVGVGVQTTKGSASLGEITPGGPTGVQVSNAAGKSEFVADSNGYISAGGNAIHDVAAPVLGTDAANKAYVDNGLRSVNQRVDQANQGVAIAMAVQNPALTGNDKFGISVNWSEFAGNNAFGAAAVGIIGKNLFGGGEKLGLTGGIGGSGNQVAGRAGLQLTW